MPSPRPDLKAMFPDELDEFIASLGQPRYRTRQILDWLYAKGAREPGEMTNLSKALRAQLAERARITSLHQVDRRESATGEAVKFLFELPTGQRVESVLIVDGERRTVCLSSQVGCPLDCKFCATGRMGLIANLEAGQIIDQLLQVSQFVRERGARVTNVVMMGMGEPLLNYSAVITAMRLMLDDLSFGLSRRRVTLSTAGLVPAIDRLAKDCPVSLAVSLHASDDALRDKLVPLNRKYPISIICLEIND